MNEQPALFVDEDKPCTRCKGTGKTGPAYDERKCLSCGGTGLARDQHDPATSELPL